MKNSSKKMKIPSAPNRDERILMLKSIYASRKIDDKEIMGKRQNRAFFQITTGFFSITEIELWPTG